MDKVWEGGQANRHHQIYLYERGVFGLVGWLVGKVRGDEKVGWLIGMVRG